MSIVAEVRLWGKRIGAVAILAEVRETVSRWPEFAEQAQIQEHWVESIRKNHRLDILP